jgi:hypothetical protein
LWQWIIDNHEMHNLNYTTHNSRDLHRDDYRNQWINFRIHDVRAHYLLSRLRFNAKALAAARVFCFVRARRYS